MRRGTTPTLKIYIMGISLEELKNIYVTLKQRNIERTKTNKDIEVDGNVISVPLSQEDTLDFAVGEISVQIRATTHSGLALASGIKNVTVSEILKEGVIA